MIASWAGTSSDTQLRSIALQVAAAEKFGLQPTGFIAHREHHFQANDPNYAKTKAAAAKLVDAMYETSQQWPRIRDQGGGRLAGDEAIGWNLQGGAPRHRRFR